MAPLSKKMIGWVTAGVATATVVVVVVLWWAGTRGLEGEKLVTARFDALRTGLSIGLGAGGLFALYLAWRRQHSTEIGLAQKQQDQADVALAYNLQERTALASEADAAARRITDLYTKAVEQLGSEKAPVRLGGLYALERLAQDHLDQRQTIVNVLCAYLRMPYTLPDDPSDDADENPAAVRRERTQEREVRLTAQTILRNHLRAGEDLLNPVSTFWPHIDLDLTAATLIDFDLSQCSPRTGGFDRATFTGNTQFNDTTFTSHARFSHADFRGESQFHTATFTGYAWFHNATFSGIAQFNNATFTTNAWFQEANFIDFSWYDHATFLREAHFDQATFTSDTNFDYATFTDDADFAHATFTGDADFTHVTFKGDARFIRATFSRNARFDQATFIGDAWFHEATLPNTPFVGSNLPYPYSSSNSTEATQFASSENDGEESE